jgi:hypothetical protein
MPASALAATVDDVPDPRRTQLARWQRICIDAVDPDRLGRFWAAVLRYDWQPDAIGTGGRLVGPTPQPAVRVNAVPLLKTVKHRVHLDIYSQTLAELEHLGATVVLPQGDDRRWTVMADPEGGEFCAFLRAPVPEPRLHGLVVDCADAPAQARFWRDVLGGRIDEHGGQWATVEQLPGVEFTFDFVPVPEPKSGPNRVQWELRVDELGPLLDRGATVLQTPDAEQHWTLLADPEGNEFRAFRPTGTVSEPARRWLLTAARRRRPRRAGRPR